MNKLGRGLWKATKYIAIGTIATLSLIEAYGFLRYEYRQSVKREAYTKQNKELLEKIEIGWNKTLYTKINEDTLTDRIIITGQIDFTKKIDEKNAVYLKADTTYGMILNHKLEFVPKDFYDTYNGK